MKPTISYIFNAFLFSGLILCFSGGFIILHIGLMSEKLDKHQRTLLRMFGIILCGISLIIFLTVL